MKAKDLFGLAIRLTGFGLCLYGVGYLVEFFAVQAAYFTLQHTDVTYYLLLGIGYIVIGLYFLRGAPHFIRYSYPDEPDENDQDTAPDDETIDDSDKTPEV